MVGSRKTLKMPESLTAKDVGQLTISCQPPWKLFPTHLLLGSKLGRRVSKLRI